MKIQLAENIRDLRKKRALTQEQLAEALGVTAGAVYKWESGRSTPEIGLLVEMADLFEVSVDALLGYEYRGSDRESTVKRLKAYLHDRDAEALPDAEKALKKYPNDFEVVFRCANLYQVRGIERRDERLLRRALELAERACLLIDQNKDDSVSALSIRTDMATIYRLLGDMDTAVRLLKEDNPLGINNAGIGENLSHGDSPEDALPFLSKALLDCVVCQNTIVTGYVNVFSRRKDWASARDIVRWALAAFPMLRSGGRPSFLYKTEAVLRVLEADFSVELGRLDEARAALRQALALAGAFDADPGYHVDRVRFVSLAERYSGHDNLGDTAMEAVRKMVEEAESPALAELWEDVRHEG